MKHENMKFRVTSPEQSERLQRVLFAQGYDWDSRGGKTKHTGEPHLFTYDDGDILYGNSEDYYLGQVSVGYNTESFIAMHSAVTAPEPFIGLEAAWDGIGDDPRDEELKASHFCPWFVNTGEQPVEDGVQVDLLLRSGGNCINFLAGGCSWNFGFQSDIIKWRYHRAEDYFKQPRTSTTVKRYKVVPENGEEGYVCPAGKVQKEVEKPSIDAHYNFTYALTAADREAGTIKIDPYFVAQQWKLGSKDDTGVVFHCLKTLARYTDKNSKEREITALYKSTVRLAELEGVVLG